MLIDSCCDRNPCKIELETDALILSRYLIEDTSVENRFSFDMNADNNVAFVRSALKHLLDNYVLLTEEQEATSMARIAQVVRGAHNQE